MYDYLETKNIVILCDTLFPFTLFSMTLVLQELFLVFLNFLSRIGTVLAEVSYLKLNLPYQSVSY